MAASCCDHNNHKPHYSRAWQRALWIALAVNGGMFSPSSRALQADALDFLGDSASYAISLAVAGMVLSWRSRAAATLASLGAWGGVSILSQAFAEIVTSQDEEES
jgi:Co/Zn/Cd efflux system component